MKRRSMFTAKRLYATAAAGATTGIAAGLGLRRALKRRRERALRKELLRDERAEVGTFSLQAIEHLPEAARRYLYHAIDVGTPLYGAVQLEMKGTVRPSPDRRPVSFTARETLAPTRGFARTARSVSLGLPMHSRDFYNHGESRLHPDFPGLLWWRGAPGADATRSALGKLAAEAVWCPTALLHESVRWSGVGPEHARFTITVDDTSADVDLFIEPDGSLRRLTTWRWGRAGEPEWRDIPYGFEVLESDSFAGITVPTRVRGGWFFGSDRFDPATAGTLEITAARFDLPKVLATESSETRIADDLPAEPKAAKSSAEKTNRTRTKLPESKPVEA